MILSLLERALDLLPSRKAVKAKLAQLYAVRDELDEAEKVILDFASFETSCTEGDL